MTYHNSYNISFPKPYKGCFENHLSVALPSPFMIQIEDIRCPISLQIFADPVFADDGITYERSLIEKWVKDNKYSPTTKEPISTKLVPNKSMKSIVHGLIEKHKKLRTQQFTPVYSYRDHIAEIKAFVDKGQFDKLLKYVEYDMSDYSELLASIFQKCKDSKIIQHIIDNFLDLESVSKSKWRLIHHLCGYSTPEMIKYAVSKGVNLECEGEDGWRPIHQVCRYSTPDVIKYMIDRGVDLECTTNDGLRPIHIACECSTPEIIKYIIDKGVDIECATNDSWRPIHIACQFSTPEIIKYMIDKGVDFECETNDGVRPIHSVCQHSTFSMLKYIVSKGVSLESAITKNSWRPIHLVCYYSSAESIKYLVSRGIALHHMTTHFYDDDKKMSVIDLLERNRAIESDTRSMLLESIGTLFDREKLLNEMEEECSSVKIAVVLSDEYKSLVNEVGL